MQPSSTKKKIVSSLTHHGLIPPTYLVDDRRDGSNKFGMQLLKTRVLMHEVEGWESLGSTRPMQLQ